MEVHECIQTRRSMRKFKEDPIPQDRLERLLAAIQWAPSWANVQPWEVVIVDRLDVKQKLQACVPEGNPGRNAVVAAPIVLAVCGQIGRSGFYGNKPATSYGDWVMFDLGIACQNICLAAWDQGLGSLHLGLLDHLKAGEILGLPENVKLYELIPIGVPAKEGKAPPRRKITEFTHHNQFSAHPIG